MQFSNGERDTCGAGAVYSEVFHTLESSINAESGSLGMRMDRCDAESSLPPPARNDFV